MLTEYFLLGKKRRYVASFRKIKLTLLNFVFVSYEASKEYSVVTFYSSEYQIVRHYYVPISAERFRLFASRKQQRIAYPVYIGFVQLSSVRFSYLYVVLGEFGFYENVLYLKFLQYFL